MKQINLPIFNISIVIYKDGFGEIVLTDLSNDVDDIEMKAALETVESMILAHACSGVNVMSPRYLEGVETAVDRVLNTYG